ncbi:hypothetical protein [Halosimplex pelagicum]|uniref:Uncharacterized protein n=1 Tax=Halosimplex pelagicum TaxID=869886 RepID=A0A7D5TGX0_9EURY|nr:hypothetical protein [Halosimplex pelagicum]QLH82196.1 hypothetical protein HZS54_11520 [Halosimplex pelagicum]
MARTETRYECSEHGLLTWDETTIRRPVEDISTGRACGECFEPVDPVSVTVKETVTRD